MSLKERNAAQTAKLLIELQTHEIQKQRDEITQLNTALTIKNGTIEQLKARVAELQNAPQAGSDLPGVYAELRRISSLNDFNRLVETHGIPEHSEARMSVMARKAEQAGILPGLVWFWHKVVFDLQAKDELKDTCQYLGDAVSAAMLAAAPQAEQPKTGVHSADPLACSGCPSGCFRCSQTELKP